MQRVERIVLRVELVNYLVVQVTSRIFLRIILNRYLLKVDRPRLEASGKETLQY